MTVRDLNQFVIPEPVGTASVEGTEDKRVRGDHVHEGVRIAFGQYTGDGTLSMAVTGIGFQPRWVWIYRHLAVETSNTTGIYFRTEQEVGDLSIFTQGVDTLSDKIISIDADGFTVDDDGVNLDPNTANQVYNYIALR